MSDRDDRSEDPTPDDETEYLDEPFEPDPIPESGPGSLAPLWARAIARIIDMFLVFSMGALVTQVFGLVEVTDDDVVSSNPTLVILSLMVVWGVYEVAGTVTGGRMLGKMALGLRIRQADVDVPPRASKALSRWLLPAITLLLPVGEITLVLLVFVYLTAITHPSRQGFHDRVAKTVVVRSR